MTIELREEYAAHRANLAARHVTHHHDCGCTTSAADKLIAALEAEVEYLKCCGNCESMHDTLWCEEARNLGYQKAREAGWPNWYEDGSFNVHVQLGDLCHFTPSRWGRGTP